MFVPIHLYSLLYYLAIEQQAEAPVTTAQSNTGLLCVIHDYNCCQVPIFLSRN